MGFDYIATQLVQKIRLPAFVTKRGDSRMARGRKVMSEQLKMQLAQELGFAETVRQQGWGAVSTKDTGEMVRLAIAKAEQMMSGRR